MVTMLESALEQLTVPWKTCVSSEPDTQSEVEAKVSRSTLAKKTVMSLMLMALVWK